LLFAYLVTESGRPVPRDELADVIWGDAVPATWEKALSVLASKLRAALTETSIDGATALTSAFGCYRLELPQGSWVDVLQAESAAVEAESLLAADEPERATERASFAESIVRLPFLPGDDGPWVQAKRRELAGLRARALAVLAEASLNTDKPTEAVRWAEQAIEAEQFRESGYRLLMAAHVAAGNRAEALRVYERCRRLLADELGTYPSPETESIYRELLETPPAPEAKASSTATPAEPTPSANRRNLRILALAALALGGIIAAVFAVASSGGSSSKLLPNSVIKIDPKTLKATEVAQVGDAPDLIVASGGYLWVTNNILRDTLSGAIHNGGDHTLTRVDPSTGAVSVVGGVEPCGLVADPSGDVWVANCFTPGSGQTSNLVRVHAKSLAFNPTLRVPGGTSFYRGLAYGGGDLWASDMPSGSSPDYAFTRVDPHTGASQRIHIDVFAGAMGWSNGDGDLWITDFPNGRLTRFHAVTGARRTIAGFGINPGSVAPDGGTVWIGDWGLPEVIRASVSGARPPRAVPLRPFPKHYFSGVWTVAAGAGHIWATTPRGHALWRIDPKTNRTKRIPLPYNPAGVAVHDGAVWVTVRGR
jgi:DNA-binding SARP family transcriptional activator/streptogramin lyase